MKNSDSVPSFPPNTLASLPVIVFSHSRKIAEGILGEVALKVKRAQAREGADQILFFDAATSEVIDVDLRDTAKEIVGRLEHRARYGVMPPSLAAAEPDEPRGRGRPKLGVVAREVTLLPRHWEWLGSQPGGASVAIRRLVEEARRTHGQRDRKRRAQEAAYRFMSAMAGDERGFEEASRALFAGDRAKFEAQTASWPEDVRDHARKLAQELW